MSVVPTTNVDWDIAKALRANDVGRLLILYSAAGECSLKELGIIQHFVNWMHNLRVRGYGSSQEAG